MSETNEDNHESRHESQGSAVIQIGGFSIRLDLDFVARILTSVALVAAVASTASMLFSTTSSLRDGEENNRLVKVERSLKDSLAVLRNQLDQVRDQIDSFSQLPDSTSIESELSKLKSKVARIEEGQKRIERTIMSNPKKALEIPLLRKEVENIDDQQDQIISSVEDEVDRMYDLNKWLFGGTAIGIISIAISNLIMFRRG